MKQVKRFLALLLCAVMVLSNVPMTAFAAAETANVTHSVSAERVTMGEEITVTVKNKDMSVRSFTCALAYDRSLLKCVSITDGNPDDDKEAGYLKRQSGKWVKAMAFSTPELAKEDGYVGFAVTGTKTDEYQAGTVFTATFKAVKNGTANFSLTEDSESTDGFKGEAAAFSVDIKKNTSNIAGTIDETKVSPGDIVTVMVTNQVMTLSTFACTLKFDSALFSCTGISGADSSYPDDFGLFTEDEEWINAAGASSVGQANRNSQIGFSVTDQYQQNFKAGTVFTATFEALKNGTANFTLTENSAGTDGFKNQVATFSVDIVDRCPHENKTTTYTSNGDDTHIVKVVCSDCSKTLSEEKANCSGGNATCETKAECEKCEKPYGDFGHDYEHFDAQPAVHTQTELKAAVAEHYYCDLCKTYFTKDKVATTLDNLTGEVPTHDNNKVEQEGESDADCENAGTVVDVTFCTGCGKEMGRGEPYPVGDPLGHTWGDPTYSWADDYSTFVAQRVCGRNANHKEEETVNAVISSTAGDCQTVAVTTYTADFEAEWAETQQKSINGQKNFDIHTSDEITYENITGTTHDEYHKCCDVLKQAAVPHNYTYDAKNHKCICGAVEKIAVTIGGITEYVPYGTTYKAEAADAQEGRTFVGYSDSNGGEVITVKETQDGVDTYNFKATKAVTLYPVYEANTYTITWTVVENVDDEQVGDAFTTQVKYGATIPQPAYTAPEGYGIVNYEGVGDTMPAGDQNYQITITPNTYTVIFNINGEKYTEQGFVYGAAVTAPAYTVPEGYIFSGWKVPTAMPAENITLNATLTVNSYTVTWDVDGVKTEETYEYGADIIKPADPIKTGYTFAGWSPAVPATMGAGDATYTATWTINTYTVTWTDENNNPLVTDDVEYGQDSKKTPSVPAKTGYTGAWVGGSSENVTGNVTIKAEYTPNNYQLTWLVDGQAHHAEVIVYDSQIVVPTAKPEKTGYTFKGWFTEPNGAGKQIFGGETYNFENNSGIEAAALMTEDVTISGQTTLYAHFEVNSYTVTFTINGEKHLTQSFVYGAAVAAPEYETPVGHSFSGWNLPATMPAENITLDATLTVNSYTVTWIVDSAETTETYAFGDKIVKPADPSKTGYTFNGWTGCPADMTMPATNITCMASFSVNQYKATFLTGQGTFTDGTTSKEIQVNYGETPAAPEIPTKAGYSFDGWTPALAPMGVDGATYTAVYTANEVSYTVETYTMDINGIYGEAVVEMLEAETDADVSVEPESKIGFTVDVQDSVLSGKAAADGSTVLKIYYIRNQYDLYTKVGEAEAVKAATYYYEAPVAVPTAPSTKEGYTFSGWTGVPETMPAEDVTVTGSFTVNKYTVTWIVDGKTTTEEYEYGATPSFKGSTDKAADAQYTYTFAGWTPEIEEVTGEATYTAQYDKTVNKYTVTWNVDGETTTEEYEYGATPSFKGSTDKAADAQYTYTFAGWTPEIEEVTGKATYTAQYDKTVNKYTVTWIVDDETVTEEYGYGATPIFKGSTDKAADAQYTYTFTSWDKEIVAVAGDVTYTAQYSQTANVYDVIFTINGEEYATQSFAYGTAVTAPKYTAAEGYTFGGWDVPAAMPAENITLDAKLTVNSYTVTFTINGEEHVMQSFAYGAAVIAPEYTAAEGYTFGGWDVPAAMPAENITLDAKLTVNSYTVTFTINGEEYVTQSFAYGAAVTAPEYTVAEGYTFGGWDVPAEMPAMDITLDATLSVNIYTIRFENNDTLLQSSHVEHGKVPSYTGAVPVKGADETHHYTFDGWKDADGNEITAATKDTNYYAVFTAEAHNYATEVKNSRVDATCKAEGSVTMQCVCGATKVKTLPVDPDNHATPNAFTYKNINDTTHDVHYKCCEALKEEKVKHDYTYDADTHKCVCGKVETYTVTVTDYKNSVILDGEYTATYDEPLVVKLKNNINNGRVSVHSVKIGETEYTKSDNKFTYDDETNTLTIDGSIITDDVTINAYAQVTIEIDLGGGQLLVPEEFKDYTLEEFKAMLEELGHFKNGKLCYSAIYDNDVSVENYGAFAAKEGHTYKGVLDENGELIEYFYFATGDRELTLAWEPNQYNVILKDGDKTLLTIGDCYGDTLTLNYNPSKEGYTFTGWNTKPDGSGDTVTNSLVIPAHDVTLYAQWQINTYTITWKNSDGSLLAEKDVAYGTTPVFPEDQDPICANPETGYDYKFEGWAAEQNGETLDVIPAVSGEATYYAVYTKTVGSYLVDWMVKGFDEDGSVAGYIQTFEKYGEAITKPKMNWVKEGYTFTDWQNVPATMPADNIVIYGEFVVNKHNITWDVDGDTTTIEDVPYGTKIELPAAPTKEGYDFVGWEGYTEGMTMPDKDVTFTAQWQAKTYTVTWTVDGETFATTTATYGQEVPEPATDPEKTGYSFTGWAEVPATMPDKADLTISAVFTADQYRVNWYANGGVFKLGGIELQNVGSNVSYGSVIDFTGYNLPSCVGYTFTGWNTKADGSGEPLTAETKMTVASNTEVVYYAQWKINTYTITFVNEDGEELQSGKVAYNEMPVYTGETPTKAADTQYTYTFAGWTPEIAAVTGNATYTAKYDKTVNKYTVKFVNEGGEELQSGEVAYGETPVYNGETPTKAADAQYTYTFAGWTPEIAAVTGEATYTAKYDKTVNKYTIKFVNEDGEELQSGEVAYGETPAYTGETPIKAADAQYTYTFAGWDPEIVAVTGEATYKATYTETVNTYTVTWNVDGETTTSQQAYNEKLVLPKAPTKDGQAFVGWFTEPDGKGIKVDGNTVFTNANNETVYYAHFTSNAYRLRFTRPGNIEVVDSVMVPYGAKITEYLPETVGNYFETSAKAKGERKFLRWTYADEELDPDMTMPKRTLTLVGEYLFTGWSNDGTGWTYQTESQIQKTGWTKVDEADFTKNGTDVSWYYLDPETGYRATGVNRVPYPDADTGLDYGPNAGDIAYVEGKGEIFLDKDSGLFIFGSDGKFDTVTGMFTYAGATRWAVKGLISWHPGMIKVDEHYYYFLGDETLGGNIMATGDVYVTRDYSDFGAVKNGVYTFGADGKLCRYHGITNMDNGTKRYYLNARLMTGNGLTKVSSYYIYVRTSGELVVNNNYYVPANDLEVAPGTYSFDENGFMINPISAAKSGVYHEDGAWFYYENGIRASSKGLISVTTKWVDGDSTVERTGVIYVRSNGQLATGTYYVTNVADQTLGIASGDKVDFDSNGLRIDCKNGIVAENGSLYYYVDNVRAYNAGVIELDGKYYYVRSNGEVVNGRSYWITNVGDSGVVAKQYAFAEDGTFEPVFTLKQGIIDGYYYVDDKIAYGAGVVEIEENVYIYVRSNGQLAIGEYWATNHNDLLESKLYDWGTDGKLCL